MQPFTTLKSVAAPLAHPNVDTDQLAPARFLHRDPADMGPIVFHDLRFAPDGRERPDFVLNMPAYGGGEILVALENFGCGSSREAAVWGLLQYGIRAVVAPSFGDIFYNNSFKNGLLPVVLPRPAVERLLDYFLAKPGATMEIDLGAQTVTAGLLVERFEIDLFFKDSLITGRDELEMTLSYMPQIEAFEAGRSL